MTHNARVPDPDQLRTDQLRILLHHEQIRISGTGQNISDPVSLQPKIHERSQIIPVCQLIGKSPVLRPDLHAGNHLRLCFLLKKKALAVQIIRKKAQNSSLRLLPASVKDPRNSLINPGAPRLILRIHRILPGGLQKLCLLR